MRVSPIAIVNACGKAFQLVAIQIVKGVRPINARAFSLTILTTENKNHLLLYSYVCLCGFVQMFSMFVKLGARA